MKAEEWNDLGVDADDYAKGRVAFVPKGVAFLKGSHPFFGCMIRCPVPVAPHLWLWSWVLS
jgi:hypothetical protein